MRTREIFVASLLTMTFGCPADDTGDTDANTSATGTAGETTNNPTTTSPTTSPMESSSSGGGMESSTTASMGSSSGTPADSSGGSSSGGSGLACDQFCTDYFAVCGDSTDNDYGDQAGCVTACELYDQATFDCKEYHASMADGPTSVHCGHANRNGGGVC